jgi:5'(3')-deoxyribonucleotidase
MKQRIGIDVDGVLRDFCGGLINVIQKHYPHYLKKHPDYGPPYSSCNTSGEYITKITDWQLEKNFNCTKKDLQQIYWYDRAKWIMGNGQPFEDNVRTLKYWMKDLNKEFVCVTSQKEHARHYTLSWLGKHGLNFDKVVFAKGKDKWQVDVDYLIDDSPVNYKYWKDGRQDEDGFILLDRPYNKKVKPIHRVFNLKEAEEIIL